MDHLGRLTELVHSKLRVLGFSSPRASMIRALFETAYLASLKTEEGRFVRGSLTFADPSAPDDDPPITRLASYPGFTAFRHQLPLTVETLVKLSRAIDKWSGSIAVYATAAADLVAWGIVDQIVHQSGSLNREDEGALPNPRTLTVTMDSVGELSVYHDDLFLGALRQDRLVTRENDALRSHSLRARVAPTLRPAAAHIARAVGTPKIAAPVLERLFNEWSNTLARLCIGLRRLGTGGAFLISPKPIQELLDIAHQLPYRRLGDSAILRVLDDVYSLAQRGQLNRQRPNAVPEKLVDDIQFAELDARERERELTGAVQIVASLAAVDGLVLLDPSLVVVEFGVKIRSGASFSNIYDGPDFARRGTRAKRIDPSRFGTRHGSMLRYCRADRRAIGVIVSQDGNVRLIMSVGRTLTLWDDVRLLRYQQDVRRFAEERRRVRRWREQHRHEAKLGLTSMPKTIRALMH
jgi:hypothetical protein